MYPGYTGSRPKMEIYHGSADTVLYPENYNETIKQWCGVFGFDYTKPETTQANVPFNNYTTYTWGNGTLIGVYAIGVGHTVPVIAADDMLFFGLKTPSTTNVSSHCLLSRHHPGLSLLTQSRFTPVRCRVGTVRWRRLDWHNLLRSGYYLCG